MNAAEHEADEDVEESGSTGDSLFGTETMAELCVRQGRLRDAMAIYRGLLTGAVDDQRRARWQERLRALENPASGDEAQRGSAGAALPNPPAPATRPGPTTMAQPMAAPASLAGGVNSGNPRRGDNPTRLRGAIHRLPLVIREPVRSGQIVYAEKNDLIVLAPVNPGAQLLADGNIHIYSRLRGRAVAGAHGAAEARIYCQKLEAELVGVDTGYLIADDIPTELWGRPAQILLREGRCVVVTL